MRNYSTAITTSEMKDNPMVRWNDSKGKIQKQRGMVIVVAMELEYFLLQKSQQKGVMMKWMERSETVDIPPPVLGKVVNQNIENLQLITSPTTTAIVIVPEVVLVAVLVIDGVVVMEVVPVENIVEESMMALIVKTMLSHHRHHGNVRVESVEEKATGTDPQKKEDTMRKVHQRRTILDTIAAKRRNDNLLRIQSKRLNMCGLLVILKSMNIIQLTNSTFHDHVSIVGYSGCYVFFST